MYGLCRLSDSTVRPNSTSFTAFNARVQYIHGVSPDISQYGACPPLAETGNWNRAIYTAAKVMLSTVSVCLSVCLSVCFVC